MLVIAEPLLMAGAFAACTATDWASIALRLATGVGEAMAFVGFATVVNDLAPDDRRGETISRYSLGL